MRLPHYYRMLNKWMFLRNNGIYLTDHEMLKGKRIAMYGLGDIGKRFLEELQLRDEKIAYVVDKNAQYFFTDFEIYGLEDELKNVDVMLITLICDVDEIVQDLYGKVTCEFISLETIVNDLWTEKWL